MDKYFFIEPRNTGKTTMAMYEFRKNPNETLYVYHNQMSAEDVSQLLGVRNNVCTQERFISRDAFRGKKITRVIFDEFLFFSKIKAVYETYNEYLNDAELLIYSTPHKIYDKVMFDTVLNCKQYEGSFARAIDNFLSVKQMYGSKKTYVSESEKEELSELYFNFITDPDVKILHKLLPRSKKSIEIPTWVDAKTVETEFKGNYIAEEPTKSYEEIEAELVSELRKGINKSIEEALKSFDTRTLFGDLKVTYEYIPRK